MISVGQLIQLAIIFVEKYILQLKNIPNQAKNEATKVTEQSF